MQFKLLWAAVITCMAVVIGTWLSFEIEHSARQRAADLVSGYIKGIFEPHVALLHPQAENTGEYLKEIEHVFQMPVFTAPIQQMKVWAPNAQIVYSTNPQIQGRYFELDDSLRRSFAGETVSHLASMEKSSHEFDRELEQDLLEVYVPLGHDANNKPLLVVELYHSTAGLRQDITAAQLRSWVIVLGISGFAYFVLAILVDRANHTIQSQSVRLHKQLLLLQDSLEKNQRMQLEIESAGQRVTQLNETFLKRVAADLHDGPAQYVAFATMQLEAQQGKEATPLPQNKQPFSVLDALRLSLKELRSITRDLALPGLDDADVQTVVRRSANQCSQRHGCKVHLNLTEEDLQADLLLKQTLFRVVQEGVTNAVKHGASERVDMQLSQIKGTLLLDIRNLAQIAPVVHHSSESMGLQLMAERVKLLGGTISISTEPDHHWLLHVELPLSRGGASSDIQLNSRIVAP